MQLTSKADEIRKNAERAPNPALGRHGWLMMACSAVIAAGFGWIVWSESTDQSWLAQAGLAAPLLLCLGLHFAMHRLICRSRHDGEPTPQTGNELGVASKARRDGRGSPAL